MKLLTLLALVALTTLANAQQIVTIVAPAAASTSQVTTNSVSIPEGQSVRLLQLYPYNNSRGTIEVIRGTEVLTALGIFNFQPNASNFMEDRSFGGPVTVVVKNSGEETGPISGTIEITPGPYPPARSAVIGERDGPMKCTLEESTDLVNWTQSTSGQTHSLTNANAKKFFRIKLEQDVGP